ncbi:PAS domain S-box protein [Pedobacter frigidisoli]|uniref:histidine kinase n=1 Tax=Pedobacter frigidisoli TaxID=2530455 RepID=A0A4R0P5C5_9SPHI|nr:ATP-binding protein [Pedobacter frigidisoli]TCD12072.1 PAS domain S-box protein [Pedobacter frigidisoli]
MENKDMLGSDGISNEQHAQYPILLNEIDRLDALQSYHILDSAEEDDFDELTTLAAAICKTPIALVSLVDRDRQWFKSHTGLNATETPRDFSFCAHAIAKPNDAFLISNARLDPRFSKNPLVTGETNIVFYAGIPLVNSDGFAMGSLCVIDHESRELDNAQLEALKVLAKQVMAKLELRRKVYELENSHNAVKESNERFELALSDGKLGSYDIDLQTTIITATPIYYSNFGLIHHEILKTVDLFNLMLPEYRDYVKRQFDAAIDQNATYFAEYQIAWPDGTKHWVSDSGKPKFDLEGNAVKMVGVTKDITNRKEFDQHKDDFLSIASHELKTPITTLKANLQLLDRIKNNPSHPMLGKLIESACRSMDKINSLVDELLNVNRFTEGELSLNKTHFSAWDMLNNCCSHVRLEGKYELEVVGDEGLMMYGDEHRIDQVVINLVNNAVKYASASKTIVLKIEKVGEFAKISVQDFGDGISAEQLPHLFQRYWRANHAGKQYSGLGLGLYICAEIIKRHGGEIGATSEIGAGSTFWFTIPMK